MIKYLLILIFALTLFLSSCNTDSTSGKLCIFQGVVEGQITMDNNSPVTNASVLVISRTNSCESNAGVPDTSRITSTNTEGQFKRKILYLSEEVISCLTIGITPPGSSSLNDTTISFDTQLKLKTSEPLNKESVQIKY